MRPGEYTDVSSGGGASLSEGVLKMTRAKLTAASVVLIALGVLVWHISRRESTAPPISQDGGSSVTAEPPEATGFVEHPRQSDSDHSEVEGRPHPVATPSRGTHPDLDAAPSPLEKRLQNEATLEREGLEARRSLIERQVLRLRKLADRAEHDGNHERARLMRERIEHLTKNLDGFHP